MWSQIFDVGTFRSRFDDVPDGFRCQAFASDLFWSAYSPKDCTLIYLSCVGPLIDRALRPHRNWNGANVLSLSNQVGDHPVPLAGLKTSIPGPTSSARRRPHPMSKARAARSRLPRRPFSDS